jgi:hypothetical protein
MRGAALTSCMPCSFRLLCSRWSVLGAQLSDPLGLTVTVRWRPLVPAPCGTLVVGGTVGEDERGSDLATAPPRPFG